MARQKGDGKGRLGGRAKGTPNKTTATARQWLAQLIDKNRRQVEKDLKSLEPLERLRMIEKFMSYCIPKQQAVSANISLDRLDDDQLAAVVAELTKDIPADTEPTEEN